MRSECRVYSGPEASYRIFPPKALESQRGTLKFVYNYKDCLKACCTALQLVVHGGKVYQVTASPSVDYRTGRLPMFVTEMVSLNTGHVSARVRIETAGEQPQTGS